MWYYSWKMRWMSFVLFSRYREQKKLALNDGGDTTIVVVWWQPESWDIYISEKGNDTEITRFIYIVMAAPFPLCF